VENWVSITTTAGGPMARRLLLNSRMGLTHDGHTVPPQHPDFAGPGVAHQGFGEHNQRNWYRHWADFMDRPAQEVQPLSFGHRP